MAQRIMIKTVKHTLTDGSDVFNVILFDIDDRQAIDFPALTEKSAETFADQLRNLIERDTLITNICMV